MHDTAFPKPTTPRNRRLTTAACGLGAWLACVGPWLPTHGALAAGGAAVAGGASATAIERGQAQFQAGDMKGALSAFDQAVKAAPRDAQPLILRGSVYQKLGKLAEAEADLRAALRLDPKLPNAFEVRAELAAILTDAKRPRDAAVLLEQLVAERPTHPDSLFNLGLAREALGEFGPAADAYGRAVRSKPTDVESRISWAGALRKAGRLPESIAASREALTLAGRLSVAPTIHAQVLDELGLAQRRTGDLKGAEASFRDALQRAPSLFAARLHLCTTLAAAGRCPEALREAAPIPPKPPFADQVAKLRAQCAGAPAKR